MRKRSRVVPVFRLAMTCLVTLAVMVVRAEANLIVNGSFEQPLVPVAYHANFPGGSTAITGWTVVGVDTSLIHETFTQSGILFQASDGIQWADLAGYNSNSQTSGVTQNVPTSIGQAYRLIFEVGSAQAGGLFFPSTIDLSIDNGPRVSFTNPATPPTLLNWKHFAVSFTATSTTTNLTFFNGGASNNYLSGLDGVILIADQPLVPSLGASGLGALVGVIGLVAAASLRQARRRG